MWRVKEAEETKDETHEALRGATGSGNVTVGPGGVGTINIGNTGTSAAGTVNVGTSATTLNIGTNKAGDMYMGNTANSMFVKSVNTYIGNTALGSTWISNGLNLVSQITLGSAPPGSTGLTSGSAPYLGSFYNPVVSTTMAAASTTQASITIGTPGVYLLLFCLQIAYTTAPSAFYVTISGANIVNNCAFSSSPINAGNTSSQGSIVVSCTASTYNMISNYVPGSGTNLAVQPNSFFQAVRIG